MKMFTVILGLIGLGLAYVVITYGALVSGQEDVKASVGKVQSTYQRRSDLIPNLVSTVQGYAAHEKETLAEVTNARRQVTELKVDVSSLQNDPKAQEQFMAAQSQLSNTLSRLLAVSERYPDLKANQVFVNLQAQLEGSENRINVERIRWQEAVRSYNTSVRGLLSGVIARFGGFKEYPYFEAKPGAEEVPKVQFNN